MFDHIHVFKQQQQKKTSQQEESSLHPPFRWLKKAVRCQSWAEFPQPLLMCHGLPDRLGGSVAMSLVYWGAQNWLLDSSLTSAEWKGHITSLAPLLMQPRVWLSLLHGGIAYSCSTCPPAPPGLLLQICFLATQPQPVLLPGAFPVQMQDFAFAVWNLMMFLSAHLSMLWGSLCTAALPTSYSSKFSIIQ